jgi:TolB protein
MSFEYDDGRVEPPKRSRLQVAIYLLIIGLLTTGLLWSGISGLVWLINRTKAEPTTIATTQTPEPISTSVIQAEPTEQPIQINRIVFISPDGAVQTIAPEEREVRVISDDSLKFQFPAWSPTGENIAAVGNNAVYLFRDADNQTGRQLYSSRSQSPFYLYWSPNGRILSFLANHPQGIGLHVVNVDNEVADRLLMTGSPLYWDWTSDSAQLFIHSGLAGEGARLALLDVQNGLSGPNVTAPGLFQAPGISQSGRYWAYSELDENQNSWLAIADKDSGEVNRQRHAGLAAFSWSPAADQLAIISSGQGDFDFVGPLRLIDAETGETSLLSRETVLAFFWSPDGRYIAAISRNEVEDEGSIAKLKDHRQVGKLNFQMHPTITLRLLLIDISTGENLQRINFQPTSLFVTQFLPFFDQYALSHRIWSPSSDAVVFPVSDNGESTVQIITVVSGAIDRIALGDMPFWSHH